MNTQILIRKETTKDFSIVKQIIKFAFQTIEYSDQTEHLLVERLRNSDAYIPELSLIAELNGQLVGHIILTKIKIKNETMSFSSLALAPVSVLPEFQGKGIGGQLILEAHRIAKELKYKSIVLLGHADYYPKFGYKKASDFNIKIPFEAPDENCMAIELIKDGLKNVSGTVEYSKAFFE